MIEPTDFSTERLLDEILDWVRIESPTFDAAAVNRMQDKVSARLSGLGLAVERIAGRDGLGDCLVARKAGQASGPGLMLIAHADTVHPVGTLAGPLPIRREADKCFGPAIYDMKGGTVIALAALERAMAVAGGMLAVPVTVVINPDEEIGSPTSRAIVETEVRTAAHVLVPEPAKGPTGEVTTGRHAFQRFVITTHGRPAHAGWTNKDGRSALRVLAQIVEELESRSNFEAGPTFAVGNFHSGQWVNCVPMLARAEALCVSRDTATFKEIGRVMGELVGERSDVRIEVTRGPVRPLWTAQAGTMELYARAKAIAADLGFELGHGQHGGGSDANFTGALGVPTLDGLGVMGHGAHTQDEHLLISSLVPRATLIARLIAGLT